MSSSIRKLPKEPVNTGMDQWQALANAIIVQAAHEYRNAHKTLKCIQNRMSNGVPMDTEEQKRLRAKQRQATASIRYHERFFSSKWFNVLSETDSSILLQALKEEVA